MLADKDLAIDPVHITVVGARDKIKSQQLHHAARFYPGTYKLLEWWDRRDGLLPNTAVTNPNLDYPAVFACSDNRCTHPTRIDVLMYWGVMGCTHPTHSDVLGCDGLYPSYAY